MSFSKAKPGTDKHSPLGTGRFACGCATIDRGALVESDPICSIRIVQDLCDAILGYSQRMK